MANQIRSALYLLRRNVYLLIALLLVLAQEACVAWLGAHGASFGGQDSLIGLFATPFICCFAAVGVTAEDDAACGLRSATCAQDGRARYVAARFLAVAVSTALVFAVTLLADLAMAAVGHPELSLVVSAPAMHAPSRLLAQYLSVLAYAELVLLVGLAARRAAVSLLVALLLGIPRLSMTLLLVVAKCLSVLDAPHLDVAAVMDVLRNILPMQAFVTTVTFPGGVQPVGFMGGCLVPLVWLAALFALARALMARRAV
ncbi:hypothetical protein [Olsenella sp. An290]|uniref:hypothetical protein n=1 Tax=Olsenella sp. An290 TaxID=1965625 RepID=UPI000B36A3EF|nr:hypothetical protein [Olsenella sp. An290]OUO34396.1 hypothetical protein B5F84_06755 [Olsenella sp. An290]